jgi:hypothetical protein
VADVVRRAEEKVEIVHIRPERDVPDEKRNHDGHHDGGGGVDTSVYR